MERNEASDELLARAAAMLARELGSPGDEALTWRARLSASGATRRIVVLDTDADEVVACGIVWATDPVRFRMALVVSAGQRGRGVGTRLLARLTDTAVQQGARTLQARADGRAGDSISFLTRRGFRETLRMHRFGLDPAKADLAYDAEQRVAAAGITIVTLEDELHAAPDVYARLGAVYDAASDEWPDADPPELTPALTGERVRAMYERWRVIPAAVFIARSRDGYVGFTGLCESGKSTGTAVRPQFRGMGIATALKIRLIRWAHEHDIAWLRSSTAHPAMIRVNSKLGFQCESVEVRLVRNLA